MVMLILTILVGCGTTKSGQPSKKDSQQRAETKTNQLMTITDATGKKITLTKQPKRIVSLIPSNTEILYKLGLGKQIVGVTDNDDYPADVKNKEKVGGFQLNIEKIISLKPDLVLAQSLISKDSIDQLRATGITVAVIKNPLSFEDVYQSIDTIGKLTGTEVNANKVIKSMKAKVQTVKATIQKHPDLKKKKVWVEISAPPDIYTTGKGTFMNEIITDIGASNAAGALEGYPKVSEEEAVKYNPDVIILTYGGAKDIQKVLNRSAWKDVSAIRNKQVYTIDTNLVSRPGPRIAEGVEQLAKIVYPSIFKQ